MLGMFFGTISIFLSIRQALIGYFKKWSLATCLYFIFFTLLSLFFARQTIRSFDLYKFSILTTGLSLWLSYDVYRLKNSSFSFSYLRWSLGLIFSLLSLLFLACIALPHLYASTPVLKIEMTAEQKKEVITWKNVYGPLNTESLSSHRVIIKDTEENTLFDEYVLGDLASLRMKVINLPRWLQMMGFPNLWSLDSVSSDYMKEKSRIYLPHQTYAVKATRNPFKQLLFSFWEKSFYFEGKPLWISSVSLSTTHIPILTKKGDAIKGHFKVVLSSHANAPYIAQVENQEMMIR